MSCTRLPPVESAPCVAISMNILLFNHSTMTSNSAAAVEQILRGFSENENLEISSQLVLSEDSFSALPEEITAAFQRAKSHTWFGLSSAPPGCMFISDSHAFFWPLGAAHAARFDMSGDVTAVAIGPALPEKLACSVVMVVATATRVQLVGWDNSAFVTLPGFACDFDHGQHFFESVSVSLTGNIILACSLTRRIYQLSYPSTGWSFTSSKCRLTELNTSTGIISSIVSAIFPAVQVTNAASACVISAPGDWRRAYVVDRDEVLVLEISSYSESQVRSGSWRHSVSETVPRATLKLSAASDFGGKNIHAVYPHNAGAQIEVEPGNFYSLTFQTDGSARLSGPFGPEPQESKFLRAKNLASADARALKFGGVIGPGQLVGFRADASAAAVTLGALADFTSGATPTAVTLRGSVLSILDLSSVACLPDDEFGFFARPEYPGSTRRIAVLLSSGLSVIKLDARPRPLLPRTAVDIAAMLLPPQGPPAKLSHSAARALLETDSCDDMIPAALTLRTAQALLPIWFAPVLQGGKVALAPAALHASARLLVDVVEAARVLKLSPGAAASAEGEHRRRTALAVLEISMFADFAAQALNLISLARKFPSAVAVLREVPATVGSVLADSRSPGNFSATLEAILRADPTFTETCFSACPLFFSQLPATAAVLHASQAPGSPRSLLRQVDCFARMWPQAKDSLLRAVELLGARAPATAGTDDALSELSVAMATISRHNASSADLISMTVSFVSGLLRFATDNAVETRDALTKVFAWLPSLPGPREWSHAAEVACVDLVVYQSLSALLPDTATVAQALSSKRTTSVPHAEAFAALLLHRGEVLKAAEELRTIATQAQLTLGKRAELLTLAADHASRAVQSGADAHPTLHRLMIELQALQWMQIPLVAELEWLLVEGRGKAAWVDRAVELIEGGLKSKLYPSEALTAICDELAIRHVHVIGLLLAGDDAAFKKAMANTFFCSAHSPYPLSAHFKRSMDCNNLMAYFLKRRPHHFFLGVTTTVAELPSHESLPSAACAFFAELAQVADQAAVLDVLVAHAPVILNLVEYAACVWHSARHPAVGYDPAWCASRVMCGAFGLSAGQVFDLYAKGLRHLSVWIQGVPAIGDLAPQTDELKRHLVSAVLAFTQLQLTSGKSHTWLPHASSCLMHCRLQVPEMADDIKQVEVLLRSNEL